MIDEFGFRWSSLVRNEMYSLAPRWQIVEAEDILYLLSSVYMCAIIFGIGNSRHGISDSEQFWIKSYV